MDVLIPNIMGLFSMFRIIDIIDIFLVTVIIYQCIRLLRDNGALHLVKGVLAFIFVSAVISSQDILVMRYLVSNTLQIATVAVLIIFQPELRKALEQLGRNGFGSLDIFARKTDNEVLEQWKKSIDSITGAFVQLSATKTGALVVLERSNSLTDIIKTGTKLDAEASEQLIGNIFFHNSPLHDGALVMRDGRLASAGCFLPLSENYQISKELGTRHRAALGMSERSDAIIVVVSEETGQISMAQKGRLTRGISPSKLNKTLTDIIIPKEDDESMNSFKPLFMRSKK